MSKGKLPSPKPELLIVNQQNRVGVDLDDLCDFAVRALPHCIECAGRHERTLPELEEVTIVLVDDDEIARLHSEFMQVEGPTDVITFHHGDIAISAETAQRQAEEFDSNLAHEIQLYIVHGLLHLNGYEDSDQCEREVMHREQSRILELCKS